MVERAEMPLSAYRELAQTIEEAVRPLSGINFPDELFPPTALESINQIMQQSADVHSLIRPILLNLKQASLPLDGIQSAFEASNTSVFNQIASQIEGYDLSPIIEALQYSARYEDFEQLYEEANFQGEEFSEDDIQRIGDELERVIENPSAISQISPIAKMVMVFIVTTLWVSLLDFTNNYVFDIWKRNYGQAQEFSVEIDVKELARNMRAEISREVLANFRLILGEGVRLRSDPGFKSEILALLPNGSLLEIIDRGNRSWLLVEVKVDDEVMTGWVSRKYTNRLNSPR